MGYFRIILAAVVMFGHVYPNTFTLKIAALAVRVFFLISGFCMELIVGEYAATGTGWKMRFYASRLMRLMPLYWLVLIGTILFIACSAESGKPSHDRHLCQGRTDAMAICWISNVFVIGHDVLHFTKFDRDKGHFYFVPDSNVIIKDPRLIPGERFNLVAQSWSLAPELMFYALVPFLLLRSTRFIAGLMIASLTLRLAQTAGLVDRVWIYSFISDLGVFLMGVLACRYMKATPAAGTYAPPWLPVVLIYGFIYSRLLLLCIAVPYGNFAFLCITALLLPSVFRFGQFSKWDRQAGEYSYPIYIVHVLVIYIIKYMGFRMPFFGFLSISVSTLCAMGYIHWIDHSLTRLRHDKFKTHPIS
jgi:peptidoglycan/LPS O-acetylase OafA/YrhL